MHINGKKYIWHMPNDPDQTVLDIALRYNLSIPIAQTVFRRGYQTTQEIDTYLFGTALKDIPKPQQLRGALKAVERIRTAIFHKNKILIAGDYDVDGITATSLMMVCLVPLGAHVNFFLPHRVHDGYGLSTSVIERAARNKYSLIITVDNGITSFEPARRAKELGIDLIITDHHRAQGTIPDAYAIVNPNQPECEYPYKFLAGVGVIFKVMSLLYEQLERKLPQKAYELLLLGTIADVVPLTGENRYWVRNGLTHINTQQSLSFTTLKSNCNLTKPKISATDIGFSIAPQINALGRLQDPRQGVAFLLGANQKEVSQIGKILWDLNQTRREIERSVLQDVITEIESGMIDPEHEHIIITARKNWPPGVIGLVASRLVSLYGRPTILLHLTDTGIAKGSCRSIAAFNIFDALSLCQDLLLTFGGHSQAAGLSLKIDQIPALKKRLNIHAAQSLTKDDLQLKINIDAVALLSDLSKKFMEDLEYLEPFGHQNPEPVFYIKNVSLVQPPTLLKESHVKTYIFSEGVVKPIIFFNRPEIFDLLITHEGTFDIVAQVKENYWNDKANIELTGLDVSL